MMELIYPTSRQFPVDEVCEEIVRALEKQAWNVPGIRVEFSQLSGNKDGYRYVSKIISKDFKLWFCRKQGMLSAYHNDIAAVTEIVIPRKELHIHEDESGPTLYLYVGNDYKNDRSDFMNSSKVNSKLHGEPKKYLRYSGACNCKHVQGASFGTNVLFAAILGDKQQLSHATHSHRGKRSPLLVDDNDLGREYDPTSEEPNLFHTEAVMEEFRVYLKENVLTKIKANKKINA